MTIGAIPADALQLPIDAFEKDAVGVWTAIPLTAPWVNVGAPYPPASWRQGRDGRIHLRGRITGQTTVFQKAWSGGSGFPGGPKGANSMEVPALCAVGGVTRLTTFVVPNGETLRIVKADSTGSIGDICQWLSLDGISFYPTTGLQGAGRLRGLLPADQGLLPADVGASYGLLSKATLPLAANIYDNGPPSSGGFESLSYERDAHGFVRIVGVCGVYPNAPAAPFVLATLPPGQRPAKREVFIGKWVRVRNYPNDGDHGLFRWDVFPDGTIQCMTAMPTPEGGIYLFMEGRTFAAAASPFKAVYAVGSGGIYTLPMPEPNTGALTAALATHPALGSIPKTIAVTRDGRYAYVANNSSSTDYISQFNIDQITGEPTAMTVPTVAIPPSSRAYGTAISPDNKRLYVSCNVSGGPVIRVLDIGADGALTLRPDTAVTGVNPSQVVITPDGLSLYVTCSTAAAVYQYTLDPATGNITPKSPASVAAGGTAPTGITLSPDGKHAYVACLSSPGSIGIFDISPSDGTLTSKGANLATGNQCSALVVTPDGTSLYASIFGTDVIGQYDRNTSTGLLTAKSPATVASGHSPWELRTAPDGKTLYAVMSAIGAGSVWQYTIGAGGALAAKAPSNYAVGLQSVGLATNWSANSVPSSPSFGSLPADAALPSTIRPQAAGQDAGAVPAAWFAFTDAAMQNAWVAYGDPTFNKVGYYKDGRGVVHLRGLIKNGASDTVCFTLPAGYRPASTITPYGSGAYGGAADAAEEVRIAADGTVKPQGPAGIAHGASGAAGQYTSLDGIAFLAEQ